MNGVQWLVMDTETTGLPIPSSAPLDKQPKIIELALIKLTFPGHSHDVPFGAQFDTSVIAVREVQPIITEKSWLINPGEALSSEINRITGLTDDDLKGAPRFAEIFEDVVQQFLGVTGLISHNLPFDLGLLVFELKRLGKEQAFPFPPQQLCTVAHYHQHFGRRAKLTEVYQRVLGKPLPQKHRALDDTRALVEIVLKDQLCG